MLKELPPWFAEQRSAGCLMHISSLPSSCGIGNLGESSYRFIDFLKESGFSFWQVCPVGPTGFGDSPYQVFSSSAGNPYFIDWEPLLENNLISHGDLDALSKLPHEFVDYGNLYQSFFSTARLAHSRFRENRKNLEDIYGSYDLWRSQSSWLHSYASFQCLKKQYSNHPWWEWPQNHNVENVDDVEYDFQIFLQYLFRGQWKQLRSYANSMGISLLGDLPIYPAPDSSEVWANPSLFQIDVNKGTFTNIAGVPPDYFNADGQFWGNPLYEWEVHRKDDFLWWRDRLSHQLELFDVVRIDHFRGFHDYWSIPDITKDAKLGEWKNGPGMDFWEVIQKYFPDMPFLAEDLGLISDDVRQLRDLAGLPGMAVLQFAFDGDSENLYLPHNLKDSLVLYTGTHDNDTTNGWYKSASEEVKGNFRKYLNVSGDSPSWDLLRFAYRTVSPLVVIPVQDLLSLGSEARFNEPGIAEGNWKWRITNSQLEEQLTDYAVYLHGQAEITGRLPSLIA